MKTKPKDKQVAGAELFQAAREHAFGLHLLRSKLQPLAQAKHVTTGHHRRSRH